MCVSTALAVQCSASKSYLSFGSNHSFLNQNIKIATTAADYNADTCQNELGMNQFKRESCLKQFNQLGKPNSTFHFFFLYKNQHFTRGSDQPRKRLSTRKLSQTKLLHFRHFSSHIP